MCIITHECTRIFADIIYDNIRILWAHIFRGLRQPTSRYVNITNSIPPLVIGVPAVGVNSILYIEHEVNIHPNRFR